MSPSKLSGVYMGRTIVRAGGLYPELCLEPDGCIHIPSFKASGQWKLLEVIELDNTRHDKRHYSLLEVLLAPEKIPWKFKNGTQKSFIIDWDHGTHRRWASPPHHIY